MKSVFTLGATALLAGAVAAAAPAQAQGSGSATMDAIKARGSMTCGVTTGVAGFSLSDTKGVIQGIDADTCRAVAAAILGKPEVRFVPTTTQNRFTALQSGEIDMLVAHHDLDAGPRGQPGPDVCWREFLRRHRVHGEGEFAGVKTAKELDGATVCVQPGTSTELAVADFYRLNKMKFTPILIAGSG